MSMSDSLIPMAKVIKKDGVYTIDHLVNKRQWVSDSKRSHCDVCQKKFNAMRRKHHCRRCGEVVCNSCCSSWPVQLPIVGDAKVRICKSCVLYDAEHRERQSRIPTLLPSTLSENKLTSRETEMLINSPVSIIKEEVPEVSVEKHQEKQAGPTSNMENMLLDMLNTTTKTQEQLVSQQIAMSDTLGNHSSQLVNLNAAISRMEKKLDSTRL